MIKILKGIAEKCRQNECREKSFKLKLNFNSSGDAIGEDKGKEQMIRVQIFLLRASSAMLLLLLLL